jgi:transcriptional regulator with XRE-family HTH domain
MHLPPSWLRHSVGAAGIDGNYLAGHEPAAALWFNSTMPASSTLPETLRQARKARRLSQLELSLRIGVSQRHMSFVESGRAQPSRELLLAWLQALEAPLTVRNAAMLQAGFAPAYGAAPLGDPSLTQADAAMTQLLHAHDPMPALLLDADWNVLRMNRGATWLALTLMPWAAELPPGTPMNMLDLLAHPQGFTPHIVNLHEVGPALMAHVRAEAAANPSLAPKAAALADAWSERLGAAIAPAGWSPPVAPVLTTRFATQHGELAFFSMFTTFGTPQDITLASLRVEHMFAADDATRVVIRSQVI